jgi:uroporphyrinogen-III decarboxylase
MTKLSAQFGIAPDGDWVRRHNEQAREVVAAWRADRPSRVPLLCDDSFIQHGLWAGEVGLDYLPYYADPDEMLRVQLEAARRRRELPIYDLALAQPPESWPITVDFWPVPAPGWLGCELSFRHDACPNHRPLDLSRDAAGAMPMPDPRTGGLLATLADFRRRIRQRCQAGLTFLGRPVGPVRSGVDHAGVFAMALDVRGPDIMADMYDEPDFAARFLLKMAEWCDALETAWREAQPANRPYFRNTDHGIDMLSGEMYERFLLPVILEMNRRRGTPLPSGLHHCGRGQHLLPVIGKHFPLQRLDDLTFPLIDVARARRDVGPEVWVKVVIEDAIVRFGPAERIRQTVRDLMASGAKGRGRLALSVGDMLAGTPLEHRVALYEAVKEFGGY